MRRKRPVRHDDASATIGLIMRASPRHRSWAGLDFSGRADRSFEQQRRCMWISSPAMGRGGRGCRCFLGADCRLLRPVVGASAAESSPCMVLFFRCWDGGGRLQPIQRLRLAGRRGADALGEIGDRQGHHPQCPRNFEYAPRLTTRRSGRPAPDLEGTDTSAPDIFLTFWGSLHAQAVGVTRSGQRKGGRRQLLLRAHQLAFR